jgi:hypothetical protein
MGASEHAEALVQYLSETSSDLDRIPAPPPAKAVLER